MRHGIKSVVYATTLVLAFLCGVIAYSTTLAQSGSYTFTGTIINTNAPAPVGSPVTGSFSLNYSVPKQTTGSPSSGGYFEYLQVLSPDGTYVGGPMFQLTVTGANFTYVSTTPSPSNAAFAETYVSSESDITVGLYLGEVVVPPNNFGIYGENGQLYLQPAVGSCNAFLNNGLPNLTCIDGGTGNVVLAVPSGNSYAVEFNIDSVSQPCGSSSARAKSVADSASSAIATAGGTCQPLTITTKSLPPAQAYSLSTPRAPAYSATLTASGGTGVGYVFAVIGLPAGLQLTGADMITGTVTSDVPDTYNLAISVTDSAGNTATTQAPVPLPTICGDPAVNPDGDDRDTIISQYLKGTSPYPNGVIFDSEDVAPANVVQPSAVTAPHCDDFASNTDSNFTYYFPDYSQINFPNYPFAFTILDNALLNKFVSNPTQIGPNNIGVDGWVSEIYALGGTPKYTISSAYRYPNKQYVTSKTKSHTPRSQHMFGDAIDMQLHGATDAKSWNAEYSLVVKAARLAGADWWEKYLYKNGKPVLDKKGNPVSDGPCVVNQLHCVHADWANHDPHTYLNP